MLRRIPDRAFVSLLDLEGEHLDSVGFSRFLEDRRQSGRDLCFVIGGPFGLDLERVDHRLALGENDAPPPAGPCRAPGAALPGAQDPRPGAVPLLMADRSQDDAQRRRVRQRRAAGARAVCPQARLPARGAGSARRRRHRRVRDRRGGLGRLRVRLDGRHDHDARFDPGPALRRRAGAQGPARAVRHRYALLRAGDCGGVLRLRPAQRPARRAAHPKNDRLLLRPLHHLRIRPRRPSGCP